MLEIVDEAFGVWSALGTDEVLESDAERLVLVRIEIASSHPDDDRGVRDAPVSHEMSDDLRFVARCAAASPASDPARRLATIRATHALVADRTKFRTEMLEAVVLALLSCYDRHPVHAAAVARRGHALLLAAPSGTGKSTIAYLCHAAGLDLLGDDQVRVQLAALAAHLGVAGSRAAARRDGDCARHGATSRGAGEREAKGRDRRDERRDRQAGSSRTTRRSACWRATAAPSRSSRCPRRRSYAPSTSSSRPGSTDSRCDGQWSHAPSPRAADGD
jgi:hypothetical protein